MLDVDKQSEWQDQSGQDRYTTEIIADQLQMLSSSQGSNFDDDI